MKFGKLENVDHVNFSLPNDHPYNEKVLEQKKRTEGDVRLLLGTTSWTIKEWKGSYYPSNTKTTEYLSAYSAQFDTIELNTTHYRIPKREVVKKWYHESTDDFIFCPKILQTISHSRDLGMSTDRMELFADSISLFEEKLGPCFMQLPPYFKSDRLAILDSFLQKVPDFIKLSVEFRHDDLFDTGLRQELRDILLKRNATAVITDVAGRRDVLHQELFDDYLLIRFVANDHASDYTRLDSWAQRIVKWIGLGLRQVFFFIHTPTPVLTPKISRYLSESVNRAIGQPVSRAPQLISEGLFK